MRISPGQELPTISRTPTSRQLVKYSVATGELAEIHYDAERIGALGLRRPVVHGGLKAAWLAQLLTRWAGPAVAIKKLEVSYRGMDLADAEYLLGGTVTEASQTDSGWLASVRLWGRAGDGRETTSGTAVVEIPR
jgi:acyl dehydratase